jgi:hypothetical protein
MWTRGVCKDVLINTLEGAACSLLFLFLFLCIVGDSVRFMWSHCRHCHEMEGPASMVGRDPPITQMHLHRNCRASMSLSFNLIHEPTLTALAVVNQCLTLMLQGWNNASRISLGKVFSSTSNNVQPLQRYGMCRLIWFILLMEFNKHGDLVEMLR